MKKLILISCIQLALLSDLVAQVIPKGMNYQAVARDSDGGLIASELVGLKIVLFSNKDGLRVDYYSETHQTTTSALGLFNLVIGEGIKDQGEYGLIPWSSENIWLEVSIKNNKHTNFAKLSSGKLLAVPYAMHAGTTAKLIEQKKVPVSSFAPPLPGVVSTTWSVFGNAKTDESGNPFRVNSLGTTDMIDVIMITNNEERLRIDKQGDIFTKHNFEVGKNLNILGNTSIQQTLTIDDSLKVKKNVLLNTLSGSTINYGPFTVLNNSPTYLSGTLIVDKAGSLDSTLTVQGPTDINSRLFVNDTSPTKLTGTLQVDGISDLNDSLVVHNMSPVHLTGTLTVNKSTNLNDSLSVNVMSPTHLSGTLKVDKQTNLDDSLTISDMGPTILSGTLTVVKDAEFKSNVLLNDTVQSNNAVTGTMVVTGGFGLVGNLNVGGSSKFGGPVRFDSPISITDPTQSVDTLTGAFIIAGGVGIGKNVNVGGTSTVAGMTSVTDTSQSNNTGTGALKVIGGTGIIKNLNVGGTTTIAGKTFITDATQSVDKSSGSLKVIGGVGINQNLNVGGMTSILDSTQSESIFSGALKVSGGVGIGRQLFVGGMTSLFNTAISTDASSGALKVTGGVGIQKQLNVGGITCLLDATQSVNFMTGALKVSGGVGIKSNINIGGNMSVGLGSTFKSGLDLKNNLLVTSPNSYIAVFRNLTDSNGISIQVNSAAPSATNRFVEFRKNGGSVIGRIQGENVSEYLNNENYKRELEVLEHDVTFAEIAVATAAFFVVAGAAELVGASSSSTACVGFLGCATAPVVSFIVKAGINVAARGVGLGLAVVRRDAVKVRRDDFITAKAPPHVGVTYESGAGDYAEWLAKADTTEMFLPGYIVGMKHGRISKKLDAQSKPMVISTQPIVLGNMPDNKDHFEKVAFLGQVPVQVLGKVKAGDYILPSGHEDGLGRAVHPDLMKAEDYDQIVGMAWGASDESYGVVNTAIGLNDDDIGRIAIQNMNEINALKLSVTQSNLILSKIIPGFKSLTQTPDGDYNNIPIANHDMIFSKEMSQRFVNSINNKMDFSGISRDDVLEVMTITGNALIQNGGKLEDIPFWNQFKTDPVYQDFFIKSVQGVYKHVVQSQLNKQKLVQK
ncbi:MAG: hypothetical protein ABI761_07690 [Saprospiraceae bacterium]